MGPTPENSGLRRGSSPWGQMVRPPRQPPAGPSTPDCALGRATSRHPRDGGIYGSGWFCRCGAAMAAAYSRAGAPRRSVLLARGCPSPRLAGRDPPAAPMERDTGTVSRSADNGRAHPARYCRNSGLLIAAQSASLSHAGAIGPSPTRLLAESARAPPLASGIRGDPSSNPGTVGATSGGYPAEIRGAVTINGVRRYQFNGAWASPRSRSGAVNRLVLSAGVTRQLLR